MSLRSDPVNIAEPLSSGCLASSAGRLDAATVIRPARCDGHVPERRCDMDSGASLLAFVCASCGTVGFRAFRTPRHAIAWRKLPSESDAERGARARFAEERAATALGWRP